MSKRGTDNQITRDEFDRNGGDDGDEGSSVMGTFKKASQDELARRPIKPLRRAGARAAGNMSEEVKTGSPFASLGPLSTTTASPSTQRPASEIKPSSNPFANISFGTTTPTPASSSTTATPLALAPSQPSFAFSGFGQPAAQPGTGVGAFANTAPTAAFANGAFTFNVGSNAKIDTKVALDSTSSRVGSPGPIDRETLQRHLHRNNESFLKKVQKEIEDNPIVNLFPIFAQYVNHRKKIRERYQGAGLEEPQPIVLYGKSKDNSVESSPVREHGASNRITRIGSGSSQSPKMNFGLPVDISASTKKADGSSSPASGVPAGMQPTSTATSGSTTSSSFGSLGGGASLFGSGSSSMKGAVDPPKNPTWNFGVSSTNSGNSVGNSTGNTSNSNAFGALSSSSASVTPMTSFAGFAPPLNAPKPFAFSGQTTTNASGGPPKPFAFQIPTSASASPLGASSPSASTAVALEENEKMPDDTKSNLKDTREGEEDEETVFEVRAKLYQVSAGENKDLGVGQFRVNENKETKKRRMIMRSAGTGQLTLNSWVIPGMPPKREDKKNVLSVFAIQEDKPKRFMVRVKEDSAAQELFDALKAGQSQD